ncbi:P-loop containing nucleoside triphosphate hydrolase protein [Elaphomyces granulatus]
MTGSDARFVPRYPSRGSLPTPPTSPTGPPRVPPRPPRVPPRPPRKPDALRGAVVDQAKQIQDSGEDITFTKRDIIIAVMGVTGAGKSTFISLLSDQENEIEIGHGLQSCTTKVGVYYFKYRGVRIFLIDTPGFDDTTRSDSEVLKDIAFWLAAAYTKEAQLAGIIYLHRISDPKMQGSALRNLRMFKQLCGTNNLNSVILATTHWRNADDISIPESVGQARTKELMETRDFWGGMIERGSKVVKHDGSKESALWIVSNLVDRKIRVILDIQRQLIDQKRNLNDTDAAQALQSELRAERKRFEVKLSGLKEDMKSALKENDVKWQKQIEEDQAKYKADIKNTYAETEGLRTNIKKISEEKDAQFRELHAEMERDRLTHEKQLKKTIEAIAAACEEQRRNEDEHRRREQDDGARAKRQADEHAQDIIKMAMRMKEESDQALRAQIEWEREDKERFYQQQREEAIAMAKELRHRYEVQQKNDQLREARLKQDRKIAREKIAALERELKARSWYNPARWIEGKYRD